MKKTQNSWFCVVAPGLALSGEAFACGLDVHMQWGQEAGVTRDWCRVVFHTFWGILGGGGGGGRDP